MMNCDSVTFRGSSIDDAFCEAFKKTGFYKVYCSHRDEIIIGVRDGYINLYYNCDSIAKILVESPKRATIAPYYTNRKTPVINDNDYSGYYETIKRNSDRRDKKEKQAQAKLFIANNSNPSSKWFCIDLEYTKSLKNWRFDIIAITKKAPFKVALIELKYGNKAMKEPSGIRSHVRDFYDFHKNNHFLELRPEIVSIINKLFKLGVEVPESLQNLEESKIESAPEYYFITLNNNPESQDASTPKQTMSGYLFNDRRWGCRRVSRLVGRDGDYYTLTEKSKTFKPVFLFSNARLPDIQIRDILDNTNYDEYLTIDN